MASISSLSSSSSIYGSHTNNMVTGLMSGLDTESMIEGLVESYQLKISEFQKDRTSLQWEQESLRSVIDDLAVFSEKYTSFTSDTNLSSNTFFTNAIDINAVGEFADAISASGRSNSEIVINSVSQLATASQYRVSAADLTALTGAGVDGNKVTLTSDSVDLSSNVDVSTLEGSLTLTYGDKNITIDFSELETLEPDESGNITANSLKTAIEEKLADESITINSSTYKASERIEVSIDEATGTISFSDKANAGNSVLVKSATGKLETTLGLSDIGDDVSTIQTAGVAFTESVSRMEYLKGSEIKVTLDGQENTITVGEDWTAENFTANMQEELNTLFGEGKVSFTQNADGEFVASTANGSILNINSEKGKTLGFGESGNLSTSLDVKNVTLGDLGMTDFDLTVNGVSIGDFDEDTALESVITAINNSAEAGVKVSYSELTNEFVFKTNKTGEGGQIEFGGLGEQLFGNTATDGVFTEGKDSVFNVTVNGTDMTLTRSSNSVELDGMTVVFKDTFNEGTYTGTIKSADVHNGVYTSEQLANATGEAVKFTETTNSDDVYDAIKSMVDDYNEMVEVIKDMYTETPLTRSNGERYEPLTDDDMADLSDKQIEEFEENAKVGLLYMDGDLDRLSEKLTSAITSLTTSNKDLADMGITTAYSNGLTTIKLDETKLRTAIETDIDTVQQVFTSSIENGGSFDGIMAGLTEVTEQFAATTGAQKGILVERAGSLLSPTSILDNTILNQMNDIDDEIETWQDKLSSQVDFYTNQFTQLEMLMNEMNSQSSALASLMGG